VRADKTIKTFNLAVEAAEMVFHVVNLVSAMETFMSTSGLRSSVRKGRKLLVSRGTEAASAEI